MFTVDNKFDIGEECYSVYRKPTQYECPICKGEGKFKYNGYYIWCKNCNATGKLHNPKQYVLETCKVQIRRIKVSRFEEKNSIKYVVVPREANINVRNRGEENLFKTKDEAEKYCIEVNTKEKSCNF